MCLGWCSFAKCFVSNLFEASLIMSRTAQHKTRFLGNEDIGIISGSRWKSSHAMIEHANLH